MSYRIMGGGSAIVTSPTPTTPRTAMPADYRKREMAPPTSTPLAISTEDQLAEELRRERNATDVAMRLAIYQESELESLRNALALARLDADTTRQERDRARETVRLLMRDLDQQWTRTRIAEAWARAGLTRCTHLEEMLAAFERCVRAVAESRRAAAQHQRTPMTLVCDDPGCVDDIPEDAAAPLTPEERAADATFAQVAREEAAFGDVAGALHSARRLRDVELRGEVTAEILAGYGWERCLTCDGEGVVGYSWDCRECECCDGVGYVPGRELIAGDGEVLS